VRLKLAVERMPGFNKGKFKLSKLGEKGEGGGKELNPNAMGLFNGLTRSRWPFGRFQLRNLQLSPSGCWTTQQNHRRRSREKASFVHFRDFSYFPARWVC
jgi:hypothetical protein